MNLSFSTALVTGGSGFIGRHMVSGAASIWYKISPLGAVLTVAGTHCLLPIATWTERGSLHSVRT